MVDADAYAPYTKRDVEESMSVLLNLHEISKEDEPWIPVSIHCVPVDCRYSTSESYGNAGPRREPR